MNVLKIQSLIKSYRTPGNAEKRVVDIQNFALPAESQLGVKGSSGSGKTTFLHLISGLIKPDTGSILFNESEVIGLSEGQRDRLRSTNIGCIYQNFNLLQGYTCLENVLLAMDFGVGRDRMAARSLLLRMELGHRLDYYPRQLSAGQQQRVAVARALANRPKLVLADEPTGSLDPSLAVETLKLLSENCAEQKAALILVSHDPAILDSMSHVVEFSDINKAMTLSK